MEFASDWWLQGREEVRSGVIVLKNVGVDLHAVSWRMSTY